VPVQAGEHVLGVRTSSQAAAYAMRQVLKPRLAPGTSPPGNLSVLLQPAAGAAQSLHGLFVTYTRTVTTSSVSRVLAALWHDLDRRDALLSGAAPQASVTVLVRHDRAYLLPLAVRQSVEADRRRWSADGFAIVDRRNVDLDLAARELTIPAPPSDRIGAAVDELRASGVSDRPDADTARPGTYPIAEWVLLPGDRTLAGRVLEAAAQLSDLRSHGGAEAVEQLAAILASSPNRVWSHLVDLREQLRSAA
jgi:hypothetical protein